MPKNYGLIEAVKNAAVAAGCLDSALPDFESDVDAFLVMKRDEIPRWIERCKAERPHRFKVQADGYDVELATAAFIRKNLTAQMQLHRAVGAERFEEIKAEFANGLPEGVKKIQGDHSSNPWNAVGNTDEKGRYTDAAIARQISFTRAVGPEKAAAVAASVDARLGDLYAPGYRRRITA